MRKLLVLLTLTGLGHSLFSQTDSALYASIYKGEAKEVSEFVYNGREHVGYIYSIKGIPYYGSVEWQTGTLVFQGVPYSGISLKYDLLTDEVIVRHQDGFSGVTLFTPWVQSFTIGNRAFVNLPGNEDGFKAGIYEELVHGTISLYVKHYKRLHEALVADVVEQKFIDHHSFYVLKDGKYSLLKRPKSIQDFMPDKRKEVEAWMRASDVSFKDDPESVLTKIVAYYNQLSR